MRCLVRRIRTTAHVSTRAGGVTSAERSGPSWGHSRLRKVKIPSRLHKTQPGWGTLFAFFLPLEFFLPSSAAFGDQLHCRLVDPIVVTLAVELVAPSQRCDVAVFVHRLVWDEMKLFADRSACIGIGAMIE